MGAWTGVPPSGSQTAVRLSPGVTSLQDDVKIPQTFKDDALPLSESFSDCLVLLDTLITTSCKLDVAAAIILPTQQPSFSLSIFIDSCSRESIKIDEEKLGRK